MNTSHYLDLTVFVYAHALYHAKLTIFSRLQIYSAKIITEFATHENINWLQKQHYGQPVEMELPEMCRFTNLEYDERDVMEQHCGYIVSHEAHIIVAVCCPQISYGRIGNLMTSRLAALYFVTTWRVYIANAQPSVWPPGGGGHTYRGRKKQGQILHMGQSGSG